MSSRPDVMMFPSDKLTQRSSGSLPGMLKEPLHRDGFVVIRHVLSPPMFEGLKRELSPLLLEVLDRNGKALQRIGNIVSLSPVCRALADNSVVLDVIARFLETTPLALRLASDFFFWGPANPRGQDLWTSNTHITTAGSLTPLISATWPLLDFFGDGVVPSMMSPATQGRPETTRDQPGPGDVLIVANATKPFPFVRAGSWLRTGLGFVYERESGRLGRRATPFSRWPSVNISRR